MSEMINDTNDNTPLSHSGLTENVNNESYAETGNPEIEAVVQFYERKIGIFENTLDLFKQNLVRINNRFNALCLVHRPLKESHEILKAEHEDILEINHNMSLEIKKKTTIIEVSKKKTAELESQIKNYEQTFEKFNSIFSYLNLNVIQLLKDITKYPNEKKWALLSLEEEKTQKSSIVSDETINPPNQQLETIKNDTVDTKNDTVETKHDENICETFDIQLLSNMDVSFTSGLSELSVAQAKSSTPCSSPMIKSTNDSNTNDGVNSPNVDGESQELTINNMIVDSPNIKICLTQKELANYKFENGCYIFIPDNDYYRVRSFVCSDEFDWEKEEIHVSCPKYITKDEENGNDNIKLSFNSVIYNTYKEIPKIQPVDGFYIASEDSEFNQSTLIDISHLTYEDIIDEKNEKMKYKFIPNLQYSYLNGTESLPKYIRNLLLNNITGVCSFRDTGNGIWPLRKVFYNNFDNIPHIQPINGFYLFLRKKDYSLKINERSIKTTKSKYNRMKLKIEDANKRRRSLTPLDDGLSIANNENSKQYIIKSNDNDSIDQLLNMMSNQYSNDSIFSVMAESSIDDRDKSFSTLSTKLNTSGDSNEQCNSLRKKMTIKKKGVNRNNSLFNPHIQYDFVKELSNPKQISVSVQEPIIEQPAENDKNEPKLKQIEKSSGSVSSKKFKRKILKKK